MFLVREPQPGLPSTRGANVMRHSDIGAVVALIQVIAARVAASGPGRMNVPVAANAARVPCRLKGR